MKDPGASLSRGPHFFFLLLTLTACQVPVMLPAYGPRLSQVRSRPCKAAYYRQGSFC
jgi:hypothetical protein